MLVEGVKIPSVFDGKETIYGNAEVDKSVDKDKDLLINNDTPLKFETTVSKMLTRTSQLSMCINEVMRNLFTDWHGSQIRIDTTNNMIIVDLVFKAISGTDYETRAFMPASQNEIKSNNQMANKIMSINAISSGIETMKLTAYGTNMLRSIMMPNIKKNIKSGDSKALSKYVSEVPEQVGFNGVSNIYSVVTGVNIYELLKIIYGRSEDGSRINYKITPMRQYSPMVPIGGQADWIIEIEKMVYSAYEKAMRDIGAVPMSGAINVVTGTISGMK